MQCKTTTGINGSLIGQKGILYDTLKLLWQDSFCFLFCFVFSSGRKVTKGEGWMQDWEISGIELHDMKFTKSIHFCICQELAKPHRRQLYQVDSSLLTNIRVEICPFSIILSDKK
jgi:hypothetical protein